MIITNLCINKVIDYLVGKMNFNISEDSDIGKYFIASQEYLTKNRLGLLILFVLNEKKECAFLIKN